MQENHHLTFKDGSIDEQKILTDQNSTLAESIIIKIINKIMLTFGLQK